MALVPFPSQRNDENLPEKGFSPFDDEEQPGEGRMTFLEHLDELRKRITHAVVGLLVGFIIAFAMANRVFEFVYKHLAVAIPGGRFIYTDPPEMFMLWIKIAALCGVLISSPYIMLQVWFFIAPGLYAKEKRFAIPFVLSSSALFIAGAAFSHYFVYPAAFRFFATFGADLGYVEFLPSVGPIFGMYVKLMLGIGLTFQLPVLMFVLARLGIVTAGFLLRNFKYAVLLIFIFAAVITPDGNPVTQVMVGGPMVLLYILGIAAAWLFGKSKKADTDN